MFGLFNKNKKQKPDWSPFETYEIHQKFEAQVSEYFSSKNIEHKIIDGIVQVPNNEFGFNQLGLSNIAQYCHNEGQVKFREHVYGHFDGLRKSYEFNKEFDLITQDFTKAKQYLGIRLYNQPSIGQAGVDKTIGKSMGGDIYAMLIYDRPDIVTSVPPKDAEAWGIPREELWDLAMKNILSKYPPTIMDRELHEISYKTVEADHFFSPNIIFDLSSYPELLGSKGSLVSLPTRHIVIVYPINDLGVVNALNTQIQVTASVSSKGPGTLSNSIFWYHNGELKEQPSTIEGNTMTFKPSNEFVEMLNQMKQ